MTDDDLRALLDDLRRLTVRTQQQDALLALLTELVRRATPDVQLPLWMHLSSKTLAASYGVYEPHEEDDMP